LGAALFGELLVCEMEGDMGWGWGEWGTDFPDRERIREVHDYAVLVPILKVLTNARYVENERDAEGFELGGWTDAT